MLTEVFMCHKLLCNDACRRRPLGTRASTAVKRRNFQRAQSFRRPNDRQVARPIHPNRPIVSEIIEFEGLLAMSDFF